MRFQRGILVLLAITVSAFAHAQTKPKSKAKRKAIEIDRQITIRYSAKPWNVDSKAVDSAFLIFKDGSTGRMAEIQLEESAPDSGEFTGRFAIVWSDANKVTPEIYIPPQTMKNMQAYDLVKKGQLPRKPIIVKRGVNGDKIIEVFERRDQAEAAWAAYQEELGARDRKLMKPIPSQSDKEAADQAKHQSEMRQLLREARARENDRMLLEETERKLIASRQKAFNVLSESAKAARRAKAKAAAEEAQAAYNAGDYLKAETKFHEAIEADPIELSYYYRYGIAQFRNEKFNPAIVSLRISPETPATALERKYFMGLVHLKLKELEPAAKIFDQVGASKDPVMAPSALFYKGVIHFSEEDFEAAKKAFEDVLDTSQDPRLDEQAESYIEQIAAALTFKKMQEQKFSATGVVGLMYDSNVLLAPNNLPTISSASRKNDIRLMTIGNFEYRPILNQKHELTTKVMASLTNSSNASLSTADPWVYTFEAPYTYKGILWEKGWRSTVRPGYELLYMALSADQAKKNLLSSPYIAFDNTLVMHQNWFSNYVLQIRKDNSSIPFTDAADNATAMLYNLKSTQTFLLDNTRQEALLVNGGLGYNKAEGQNKTYKKLEVGVTYARPIGTYAWNAGLSYYYLTYPTTTPSNGREDNNTTFTTGFSKPIKDWFTWGVLGSYATNASSQAAYSYNKITVLTTATFTSLF